MKGVYLDNAATTRVADSVVAAVGSVMSEDFGNASSLHDVGRVARGRLEEARGKIASCLGCEASEIVFTSGGTESNNLAIRGLALANPSRRHIITSVIEHPCVLESCRALEREGYEVDYIGVDSDGLVSVDEVLGKIRDDTLLVSVMSVNNEVGVLQDVEGIGEVCRGREVYFHTDNVQGFLKESFSLENVDLMSVSGHKVCAPKGIGVLYVRRGVRILPVVYGGGQEGGLRSGTENVPGAVGLAAAVDVDFRIDDVRKSRDKIVEGLRGIPGAKINGSMGRRVYNNVNVSFYGIEGESLMMLLNEEGIYVSTGSACASSKLAESYVLKAMGVDEMYIHGSIRLSLGVDVLGREEEVVGKIRDAVLKLREMSPFKFSGEDLVDGGQSRVDGACCGGKRYGSQIAQMNADSKNGKGVENE